MVGIKIIPRATSEIVLLIQTYLVFLIMLVVIGLLFLIYIRYMLIYVTSDNLWLVNPIHLEIIPCYSDSIIWKSFAYVMAWIWQEVKKCRNIF